MPHLAIDQERFQLWEPECDSHPLVSSHAFMESLGALPVTFLATAHLVPPPIMVLHL